MKSQNLLRICTPIAVSWVAPLALFTLGWLTTSSAAVADGQLDASELGFSPWIDDGRGEIISNVPAFREGISLNEHLGADRFYAQGITGQGVLVANVEEGHIWNGHETLGHVERFEHHASTWGSTTEDLFDRHATWVASIMGGRSGGDDPGEHQLGIAHGAELSSGAIATRWTGSAFAFGFSLSNSTVGHAYGSYFGDADVINSSWGGSNRTGTNNFTKLIDALANENPQSVFVAAAGNRFPRSSSNSVIYPASGYNGISVGALDGGDDNSYDQVADFSNRGPQDYADPENGTQRRVRAPVDIVAPGTNITAAYYGGTTGGNNSSLPGSPDGEPGEPNSYTESVRGTSFATPLVSGGAALLMSASRQSAAFADSSASRDARVVKSVLLNSAAKTVGWDNGQIAHENGLGGVETTQSLDFAAGAGALDLDRAYEQYLLAGTRDVNGLALGELGSVDVRGWDFGMIAHESTNRYLIEEPLRAGSDFTATLSWFRDRAVGSSGTTGLDEAQADLNLLVWDTISGDLISESSSLYNVVEHLHFEVPRTSNYALQIDFVDETFGEISLEEYGLAWFGTAVPEPAAWQLVMLALWTCGATRRPWRRL